MLNPRFLVLPLLLLLYGFTDAASGLAVEPPNDFIAAPLPLRDDMTSTVLIGIFRYDADLENVAPPFCVLSLHAREDNAPRTQTELNTRMRDPGRLANIIDTFSGTYAVLSDRPIELSGVFGHQFTIEDRDAAGDPQDLLQVNSTFDTPKGRITLNCGTARSDLKTNMVSFGLIRDSITLP